MPNYVSQTGAVYSLPQQHLARGGEGSVYNVIHHPDLVAKIYHPNHLTPALQRKLETMVANPPVDDTRRTLQHVSIAWPEQLLYQNGRFVGYMMKKISQSDKLYMLIQPQQRKQKYPNIDHRVLYRVARNYAAAMAALHHKNYIVGDVNPNNALFNNRSLVTIVDCDSMQVIDRTGQTHLCIVGMDEYTAQELQGKDLRRTKRTQDSDTFGLAVIIYQLLMQGFHPFQGVPLLGAPNTQMSHVYCIANGIFPHITNNQFTPPPAAPAFGALPKELQDTFKRAFLSPNNRPSAKTWQQVLATCEQRLQRCTKNDRHYHPSDGQCVICAVQSNTQKLQFKLHSSLWVNSVWMWIKPRKGSVLLWVIVLFILIGLCSPVMSVVAFMVDLWRTIFGT
jgi:DNA-binding helix-hairpin-helix protein with protein kinase domain